MQSVRFQLLQLCVLRFGFFQDGDVGVGVFPEGQEGLIHVGPYLLETSRPVYFTLLIRTTSLFTEPRARNSCLPSADQANLKIVPSVKLTGRSEEHTSE